MKTANKNIVRLTEAQLNRIIAESIQKVLMENDMPEGRLGRLAGTALLGGALAMGAPSAANAQNIEPKQDTTASFQNSVDKMKSIKDKRTAEMDSIKREMDNRAKEMKSKYDANKAGSALGKKSVGNTTSPKVDYNVKK